MKATRLVIPIIVGLALVFVVLISPAYAQSEYFLIPAVIYDYETWSDPGGNAGGGFLVSGNSMSMDGTCTYDGGWTYCGAAMAVARPGDVDAVLGFVIDWSDATVDTQTHASPQAIGFDLGNGSVFGGQSGCAVSAACPSPYVGRWCMTDIDPGDLEHLDCNEEPNIWSSEAVTGTNDSLAVFVVQSSGGTLDIEIDVETYWLVLECPEGYVPNGENVCVEDEGPPPAPPVEFPTCSFNYTSTITTTAGTGTATYSYTVSANLIQNGSFEEGGYFPDSWTFVSDIPPLTNQWWGDSEFLAYSGSRYMDSYSQHQHYRLVQDMQLYASGQYQAGFYARPSAHYLNAFGQVKMIWGGSVVAQSGLITNTWQVFSGTRATGGGSAWLEMAYFSLVPGTSTDVYGDHAFIWPIDSNGDILCDPSFYPVPPGQPVTSTVPIDTNCAIQFGDVCFPAAGDTSCWDCQRPTSFLELGRWISWLVCQVRNLFFCHLYHWLLSLGNLVLGVFGNVFSFLNWLAGLPNTALAWLGGFWQDAIDWMGGAWQSIWTWVGNVWSTLVTGIRTFFHSLLQRLLDTPLVQFLYGVLSRLELILEFGAAAFAWFINALQTLGRGIISLIELVVDLFQSVIQAFIDPEYDWSLVPGANPDGGFLPGDLGGDGPSPQKVLWLILLGLGTLDASIGDLGVSSLQYVPIGLLSIGLVLWTLKKWEFILPAA